MSLELAPLGTVRFQIQPSITLEAAPRGTLHIFELTAITIEGDRLQAKQKGVAAADWLLVDNDQVGTLDVRYCAETVEGAVLYVTYAGKIDLSGGLTAASVYATPQFQTGDPSYAWLNKIQAVAKGKIDQSMVLTYEVYELR